MMRFLLPGSSSFVSDDWKESVADFGKCSFAFWLSSRSSSASWLNWWCRAHQARVVRVMKIDYKKLCSSTYRSFPNITFFSKICVKDLGPYYTRVQDKFSIFVNCGIFFQLIQFKHVQWVHGDYQRPTHCIA